MLFNSYAFIFLFLPLSLAVSLPLRGRALLRCITLLSLIFYAFAGNAWFLLPIAFTTTADFLLAPQIARRSGRARSCLTFLSLSLNLGLLFYFKYAGLFLDRPSALGLPAGISFYTFQTMAYIIDVHRGQAEPEPSFWKFASFVTFFPHLVAGPLTRHDQLIPALSRIESDGIQPQWQAACSLFFMGLAKKVLLGDSLARIVDYLLGRPAALGFASSWLLLLGFTLQIYFDFGGYSDMALGLGRLFSVQLPRNFDLPYLSESPSEFWSRWHITLSRWLRDYLYISLGGNRLGPRRRDFNLLLTMLLGGLWHGASWTFAAWGLYHGLLLILQRHTEGFQRRWPRALRITVTFVCISLGWVFFRAADFTMAGHWFAGLAGLNSAGLAFIHLEADQYHWLAIWAALGLACTWCLPEPVELIARRPLRQWEWALLGLIGAASLCCLSRTSTFLYFQF